MNNAAIKEKVALITGGASGIGLAMAKILLTNNLRGVAIVEIDEEGGQKAIEEIEMTFGKNKAIFVKTDVSDKKQLEEAFDITIKTYKQLDIVINNAGMADEIEWEKTLALNLEAVIRGSYLALRKYLPQYKSGDEGVIVNIASILGLNADMQSIPVYSASKHGVVALGQSLGGDEYYRRHKVRVITICPGGVRTPLILKTKTHLPNIMKEETKEIFKTVQDPEYVAEALVKVLNEGKSGSLWVTEASEPAYEVVIPKRQTFKI